MSATAPKVGIHLARDRATLAVLAGATAQVVPNASGALSTPAAVWVDKRGRVRVGDKAAARARRADGTAVGSVVGRLVPESDRGFDFADGTGMDAAELVAEIVRSLRLDFAASTGSELVEATIAVPDGLATGAAEELLRAVRLAGIERAEIVPESVAASAVVDWEAADLADASAESAEWLVLVTDEGGFSACILRRAEEGMTPLARTDMPAATAGALNERLVEHVQRAQPEDGGLHDIDLRDGAHAELFRRLVEQMDAAKRDIWRLGTTREVYVEAPVAGDDEQLVELEFALTPELLAEVESEVLASVTGPCLDLVTSSGLVPASLRAVLLVGACAEDPHLQHALRDTLGLEPRVDPAPDTVIARGAAALAAGLPLPEPAPSDAPRSSVGAVADIPDAAAPQAAPLDPVRFQELRLDARTQRRRLLALYRRAGDADAETLRADLHRLVQQRFYERMDALIQAASTGEAVDEHSIVEAIGELERQLDGVVAD